MLLLIQQFCIELKISIVIPCHNAKAFIERAVRSVIAQSYQDVELIVVDDHSTDNTLEILTQLQSSIPILKVLKSKAKGACVARNVGFQASTGNYILFLDADDEILPARLHSDIKLLAGRENTALVVGAYTRKSAEDSHLISVQQGNSLIQLFNGELGCTCSNLFKRETFEAAGKWSEDLLSSQEADLMLRILQNKPEVLYNTEPNTNVYIDDSVISKRDPTGNLRRYFDVRLKIYDEIITSGELTKSFQKNAGHMFYGILHRMYRLNLTEALQMHAIINDKGIKVAAGPGVSSVYKWLCSIFGFRLTEKLFYRHK